MRIKNRLYSLKRSSIGKRLERLVWSVLRRYTTGVPRGSTEWLDTPFRLLLRDSGRRAAFFRRLAIELRKERLSASRRALTPRQLLDGISASYQRGRRSIQQPRTEQPSSKQAAAKKALAKRAPVKKAAVKRAPAKKAPAKRAPAKKAAVKRAPAKKAPAKRAPAKKAAVKKTRAKRVGDKPDSPDQMQKGSENSSVCVFFATDRQPLQSSESMVKFGSERQRDGKLIYGTCSINIPKGHRTGHIESPSWLHLELRPNPNKHIFILETITLDEEVFLGRVASAVADSQAKDAFIFVHGYNCTFEDAALRTGQMAFDLSFIGAPILYSWPSKGHIRDYPADETNVSWTSTHFERFLDLIATGSGAKRIHVIAHSMGNRAVCDALRALSLGKPGSENVLLHHLVLAAPDIDADIFRELAAALKRMSGHITLYASSNDKAIKASRRFHKNPRAGGRPLVIVPGVESIDASDMGSGWLQHSYVSDRWALLSDLHALLFADTPAARRFGLVEEVGADGIYYVFRA
jgi:esterase/lipase superfamily enzyme